MAEDLLDRIVREVRERKGAARAAYEESQRLERALAALGQQRDAGAATGRKSAPADRRRGARRRRRAAPGANRDTLVAVARERPGATAGELATATGIARATVSSTLARLVSSGALERTQLPGGGVGFRVPAAPAPDLT
jgi:Fic family protein